MSKKLLNKANNGDAKAQFELGDHFTKNDQVREGFTWFLKSAEQNYAPAQNAVGEAYSFGNGVEKDSAEAMSWFQRAADQGDPAAQCNLAAAYHKKFKNSKPEGHARLLKISRDRALLDSQYNLGCCYRDGIGVAVDYTSAAKYFKLAAEGGAHGAMTNLAELYLLGQGVPRDEKMAFKWILTASKNDNPTAQYNCGDCYHKGVGVAQSDNEAIKWYELAAANGQLDAMNSLGIVYDGQQDFKRAYEWFKRAADQGHAMAQCNLGTCFYNGKGIEKSHDEAAHFFQLSASQGYNEGQFSLGICYAHGYGVKKDVGLSIMWLRRAASQACASAQRTLQQMKDLGYDIGGAIPDANSRASVLVNQAYKCVNCGAEATDSMKILRCGGCKVAGYCSRECQVKHWKKHKKACKGMALKLKLK